MTWQAKIRAPHDGPVYVHHEEAGTVNDLLGVLRCGFDFERAESVTITITRVIPREKEQA